MLFHMWWWLIPLMFFLAARGGRRRYYRERGRGGEQVAELQRTVETQREYIEQLEARLGRVEEGLEFAERLLSERAGANVTPAGPPARRTARPRSTSSSPRPARSSA